jgi:hypothetical protein
LQDTPAQDSSSQAALPQSTNDALRAMSRLAGVIFTGQVISVRRLAGVNGATGVVEIAFAVQDAIRGVSGSSYTLREWAGLWPVGDTPFRVGQRYLMLLHAPSAAGLSSPVGGMDGAIPIRGGGSGAAAETAAAGTIASADERVADLRWVGTRAVKPVSYHAGANAEARSDSVSDANTAATSQSTSYTTMLGMLRSWEKADAAAR